VPLSIISVCGSDYGKGVRESTRHVTKTTETREIEKSWSIQNYSFASEHHQCQKQLAPNGCKQCYQDRESTRKLGKSLPSHTVDPSW